MPKENQSSPTTIVRLPTENPAQKQLNNRSKNGEGSNVQTKTNQMRTENDSDAMRQQNDKQQSMNFNHARQS